MGLNWFYSLNDVKIDKLIASKRKTISLEVAPDAALIVRTPHNVSRTYIQSIIFKKRNWILKKQREIRQRMPLIQQYSVAEYWEQACSTIIKRVDHYCVTTGLKYRKFSLSRARRRWGSCSQSGNVRFNWRLILVPLPVIDYVVVHELMHLVVKNHSKKFWRKVSEIMPNYRVHRKWLRENGQLLSNQLN
ncbi:hypothetical protein A3H38_03935 [candidate division WOR-1 bacterium RIFCSPLOWO2_02_FULL_46_20]|uniref:YgjP-like metallopeptidase domain-containing protein n=2 Tax=Saganbacteria TaxID=1703751 RepID=A0A1F4RE73_UNCSA|nr:MAG: hypothetical protein A3H38_03935 [candidate division WOR-1 bacterium RIFCSPLOWO2_02_FULL_46_20]